jgi:NAD(P)-dependent dehydrogenase (short-subunit alcohol dehydrogenase family)
MQIAGHTFFVSGGCSGLGEAVSLLLAEHQANVIIADTNEAAGEALARRLQQRALFRATDVTKPSAIDAALRAGTERFGALHGLINCAGVLIAERLIKKDGTLFDPECFRRSLDVNLLGTFYTLRAAAPYLAENGANREGERGVIINTASIAAYEGQIGQAAYAAAKAGVIGMTLPLARELAAFGIRVMTIAPGVFDTPLLALLGEAARTELERQVPFPSRLGKPEEYAALALHVIENPMLNGEVIRLDGALRFSA